jgi:hypothetical protein
MRRAYRSCFSMKLATLVLVLSAVSLTASRADDASVRSLQVAQATQSKPEHQSTGACTPIGLTANGEIVFPWECRETIEKQRGPVSVNVPVMPNDPPAKDQPASSGPRPEDAIAPPPASQPVVAATDRSQLPPDANAAPAKPHSHRRTSSAARLKEQQAGTQLRPTVGAVVRVSNKDKVALQRGTSQK